MFEDIVQKRFGNGEKEVIPPTSGEVEDESDETESEDDGFEEDDDFEEEDDDEEGFS